MGRQGISNNPKSITCFCWGDNLHQEEPHVLDARESWEYEEHGPDSRQFHFYKCLAGSSGCLSSDLLTCPLHLPRSSLKWSILAMNWSCLLKTWMCTWMNSLLSHCFTIASLFQALMNSILLTNYHSQAVRHHVLGRRADQKGGHTSLHCMKPTISRQHTKELNRQTPSLYAHQIHNALQMGAVHP